MLHTWNDDDDEKTGFFCRKGKKHVIKILFAICSRNTSLLDRLIRFRVFIHFHDTGLHTKITNQNMYWWKRSSEFSFDFRKRCLYTNVPILLHRQPHRQPNRNRLVDRLVEMVGFFLSLLTLVRSLIQLAFFADRFPLRFAILSESLLLLRKAFSCLHAYVYIQVWLGKWLLFCILKEFISLSNGVKWS